MSKFTKVFVGTCDRYNAKAIAHVTAKGVVKALMFGIEPIERWECGEGGAFETIEVNKMLPPKHLKKFKGAK